MSATAAAAAATVALFNLACTGTQTMADGAVTPFAASLRVDLKAGRFCEEPCTTVRAIAGVLADTIVFQDAAIVAGAIRMTSRRSYVPSTRTFEAVGTRGEETARAVASCEVRPFTGFGRTPRPEAKGPGR